MAIETRAQNIIITDARDLPAYHRYVKENESLIANPAKAMWKKQAGFVTPSTVELALKAGTVPDEWKDPWKSMIREFVREDIGSAWLMSISEAGSRIAVRVNRIQLKAFEFDATMRAVKAWIDSQGGTLIVDLTAAQVGSIHALLQDQFALGVTSPYILAQRIKPMVGLTVRETGRVA